MSDWPLSGAWIFWGLVGLGIAFGIARGLIVRLRENAYNAKLRAIWMAATHLSRPVS
jgi:hypothetical protein